MPYSRNPPRTPAMPVAQMNLTPLIDVLLVLIVMLIITVPLATHSLEVPLPTAGPAPYAAAEQNTVTINEADQLQWNGRRVTETGLLGQLAAAAKLGSTATVRFEPAPNASYDRSAQTIALIKDSGIESFAFVGNEQHRSFAK